ncbi:UNVERIFIED_CONTAM: hypothetical protein H355_015051 [Colinus virginianus]|nr:hypothetical protein H355_015051 [Colinus virginianus]
MNRCPVPAWVAARGAALAEHEVPPVPAEQRALGPVLPRQHCREAYAIGKKEKPPFLPEEPSSSSEEDDPIPDELLCLICKDIMTDAVVIPCCGNSYCDECKYYSHGC